MRNGTLWFAAVLAVLCIGFDAQAHDSGKDLKHLVERANLVFVGQATRVEYRSLPSANRDEGLIPHTFVTYAVERVLRGSAPGQEITLRFIGGPDGRGRFLTVSRVPIVQQGDRDLLFVDDAADASCPLVQCEKGRFRILGDRVYNAHGAPVLSVAQGKIVARGRPPQELLTYRYPAPSFDDLLRNPEVVEHLRSLQLSMEEARRRYAAEAPKEIVVVDQVTEQSTEGDEGLNTKAAPQAKPEPPVTAAHFLGVAESIARSTARKPAPVRGADMRSPVAASRLQAMTPGNPPARQGQPGKRDEAEAKALEANGFNPVIRKRQ